MSRSEATHSEVSHSGVSHSEVSHADVIEPMAPAARLPAVQTVTPANLKTALQKGLDDFRAMPTHAIFLVLIYPVAGLLIGRLAFGYNIVPLLYPLAAGFALLGPVAAIGLYELSRRRELGLDTKWTHAFDVFRSPSFPSIAALGLLLLAIFSVWIAIANGLYISAFGYSSPESFGAFMSQVFGTPEGLWLIVAGNLAGFLFALLVLFTTVVSFPLLLDRNVGAPAAMITSARVVLANPVTMALWGLIIAGGLVLGFLPLMFGLAVVLPVLGHASWHLYRAAVAPDTRPRPEHRPRPRHERYGAQFPASLIFPSSRE